MGSTVFTSENGQDPKKNTYIHPPKTNMTMEKTNIHLKMYKYLLYMDVSENSGTPKSSNLIGFSIINHAFWGTPNFWKHVYIKVGGVSLRFLIIECFEAPLPGVHAWK